MKQIFQLKSSAKINLTLDILGKDKISGYHFIQSVIQEVPWLYDEIFIEINNNTHDLEEGKTKIKCHDKNIPCDQKNTIWQAIEIMRRETNRLDDIYIEIKKNIPAKNGLGGGSSNAAQILKFLNKYWKLNKSKRLLAELGAEIGMDVPFFIWGGTCFATHFGEKIEKLPDLEINEKNLEIIFTNIEISTKNAYKNLDLQKCGLRQKDTLDLVNDIKDNITFKNLTKYFHNDFEKNNLDLKKVHLCGSGGANFFVDFKF